MDKIIRKAVFPVAGLGTRFLPATKANPKEMLTVVDKPLIQYAAEEAVNAGIDELIFVTSSSKRAIEDHFDKNYELESELEKKGKNELLKIVREVVPANVTCVYVRQPEALGLGHAVLCARPVVGEEPFAVILADDLINSGGNCVLAQMASAYNQYHASVLGVEEVPAEETDKYGIVDPGKTDGRVSLVQSIVEKPAPEVARSNLAVVGRYILTPTIFNYLEKIPRGAGGEIQLTDAIEQLLLEEKVLAYRFEGKRYDCGSKLGYLQATVEYALQHPELRDDFLEYLVTEFGQGAKKLVQAINH
ncbi:MAG: UTP--glucose-1-phosphate uridylyltransferase GalU [Gammaproteobacteria bacterium]|jgi:UTP--glucose-1-phosphate uridylyltransferase|nr:UTP--glucose-1-phosphate uridylyltransferase GalU [Gammaproteobacteria bacterium]